LIGGGDFCRFNQTLCLERTCHYRAQNQERYPPHVKITTCA
jgi:hypothetical protein